MEHLSRLSISSSVQSLNSTLADETAEPFAEMFIWIASCAMVAGIAAFDGYSEVVDLFNHRWTDTCTLFTDLGGLPVPRPMLNAIGPCQADLEVVKLPPKYQPNWILNADCAPGCLRRNCSAAGSKPYTCQQVKREVFILDQDDRPQSFTISLGCLCTELSSRFAEYRPPLVS